MNAIWYYLRNTIENGLTYIEIVSLHQCSCIKCGGNHKHTGGLLLFLFKRIKTTVEKKIRLPFLLTFSSISLLFNICVIHLHPLNEKC